MARFMELPQDFACPMKRCHRNIVHADETCWREALQNVIFWYAGNENVTVFQIDLIARQMPPSSF